MASSGNSPPAQAILLLLVLCAPVHSFFFSSGRSKSQVPQWFGIRDYGVPAQAAYSYDSTGGVTVAVPVAIPLPPQQVSPPYPGLAPVQLVPCLCPISKDPEALKPVPGATSAVQPVQAMQSVQHMQPVQHMQSVQHMQPVQHMQSVQHLQPAPTMQQQVQMQTAPPAANPQQ